MATETGKPAYESPLPFDAERIHAAAVHCSDGRFGEHIDDFLHNVLGLPKYDRLAIPGGAACLAGHFVTYREEEALAEQLRFLIAAHRIRRVVLIAHEGCAYYLERLHASPLQLHAMQLADLEKAVVRVRSLGSHLAVDPIFAYRDDQRVRFERVEFYARGRKAMRTIPSGAGCLALLLLAPAARACRPA